VLLANSSFVTNPELNSIACVDVSFSDAVQNVPESVLDFVLVVRQLLNKVVVADELVIEHGHAHRVARALSSVLNTIVRADGIVAVHNTLAILLQAAKQVEGVERHEASSVEGVAEQLRDGFNRGLFLLRDFVLTNFDF